MSGTKMQHGKGMALLALGVALALASIGCVGAPGELDEDDEDVADAVLQLEEGTIGSGIDEEGDVPAGEESQDPQPVPWLPTARSGSDPTPDPTPIAHGSSSTPSGGNGGK